MAEKGRNGKMEQWNSGEVEQWRSGAGERKKVTAGGEKRNRKELKNDGHIICCPECHFPYFPYSLPKKTLNKIG